MKSNALQERWRLVTRSCRLGAEVLQALVRYVPHCAMGPVPARRTARARWLQRTTRRALTILDMNVRVQGPLPQAGLVVCNHLSYLDILVLSALLPCVFVAKREVKHWPVLGWMARLSGTLFVHRERRSLTAQAAAELDEALREGALVVLFPEGTSSGGATVLPFKSSLLEPAVRQDCDLTAALIHYELEDGSVTEEVCYWKDMTLLPHLLNLLRKRSVRVRVLFAPFREEPANRKDLARRLHREVLRLKDVLPI